MSLESSLDDHIIHTNCLLTVKSPFTYTSHQGEPPLPGTVITATHMQGDYLLILYCKTVILNICNLTYLLIKYLLMMHK